MWCRHCKQDVPAVAPAAGRGVQCARCHHPLGEPAHGRPPDDSGVALDAESEAAADPVALLKSPEAQLRREELTRSLRAARRHATTHAHTLRFDPPQALVNREPPTPTRRTPARDGGGREPHYASQWLAWSLALLGALALGIGLGLMGWSLVGARADLWNWGVAATLAGQGLMIIGLVQLLASLWTGARSASGKLIGVQHEVRKLQRTTESLMGASTGGAANFYAELARGASPGVLLANLKSQVDELAAHLANR